MICLNRLPRTLAVSIPIFRETSPPQLLKKSPFHSKSAANRYRKVVTTPYGCRITPHLSMHKGSIAMANFQKVLNDKTTRLDTGVGRLVLMLEETAKIDLYGGGPAGEDLTVDFNDATIGTVSEVKRDGLLRTFQIQGLKSGNAMLEARLFNQTPANAQAQRQLWFSMPVWASLQVSVLGAEYRQAGGTWGNLAYGSTNPRWKHVHWTN